MSDPRDEKVMPFLEHLEELRRMIFKCIIVVVLGAGITWAWSGQVLSWLIAMTSGEAIFMKPQGAFLARLKVAIVLGILISVPLLFYWIWSFIGPGLLSRERRVVFPGALASVFLFYTGILFSYFLLTPLTVKVLLGFGTATLTAQTEVHFLLDLVFSMGLACGLVFQLPIFAAFLTTIGVIRAAWLLVYWRHAVVVMFILAALLTPADPLSQILLAVPLMLLYWLSYGISWTIERRRGAPEEQDDDQDEDQGEDQDEGDNDNDNDNPPEDPDAPGH